MRSPWTCKTAHNVVAYIQVEYFFDKGKIFNLTVIVVVLDEIIQAVP